MPSDKRNSITVKATASLIFSLFDVALARQVPFGILQYVQCIRHRLTSVLLCVPFIFADRERCSFYILQYLHQFQYHTLVPTTSSSYFTYQQESMFTSTLSYHEQLFNGTNYLSLILTRLTLTLLRTI